MTAAAVLDVRAGQISNIESARFGISTERIRTMATAYGCTDEAYINALVDMAPSRNRGWWEEYRDILPSGLLDLAELEHHGTAIQATHTAHIPGLLQTVEHAREIYRQAVPEFSPPDIEHRVSHRIKRQAVLHMENPAPYQAIIHEAALRMRFGGASVAAAQLHHLLKLSEMDHVTIRVIPFSTGSFPGSGQTAYLIQGPVPQLDTVQLDQAHGVAFLDSDAELSRYRMLFDRLETSALAEPESRDLIRSIAKDL